MDTDLKQFVESTIRKHALAEVKSEGNVETWWDKLPGKRKSKVINVLGLSKGKDKSVFLNLTDSEKNEVSAYFLKHHGRVENDTSY